MKFDFNIRPAAELPAREALRPLQVNELAAPVRTSGVPADAARLNLLARRQERWDRRANR